MSMYRANPTLLDMVLGQAAAELDQQLATVAAPPKEAFVPAPAAGGGQPQDPSMQGMPPGGDPAAGGMPPQDPSMQGMPPGGDPAAGGGGMPPGGDPSMGGGQPAPPPGPPMPGGGAPGGPPSPEAGVLQQILAKLEMIGQSGGAGAGAGKPQAKVKPELMLLAYCAQTLSGIAQNMGMAAPPTDVANLLTGVLTGQPGMGGGGGSGGGGGDSGGGGGEKSSAQKSAAQAAIDGGGIATSPMGGTPDDLQRTSAHAHAISLIIEQRGLTG